MSRMKTINSKLRSRSGASMIIAMVFLLFCVLVGGSVLAAATANASRVKHLAEQQDYLDQRSAALLLADRLKTEPGMQVMISDTLSLEELGTTGTWSEVTGVLEDVRERSVVVEVKGKVNPLQRLMVETAILKYLNGTDYNTLKVTLTTETGTPVTMNSIEDFSCYKEAVTDTLRIQGGQAQTLKAKFSCGVNYDFVIDMQVGIGQTGSRTIVETTAASEQKSYALPQRYSDPVTYSTVDYVWRLTETVTYTVISWNTPSIEKGAVAS